MAKWYKAHVPHVNFEISEMEEQGGEIVASSKKPFFTKNIIIAAVAVIVSLVVGVLIYFYAVGGSSESSSDSNKRSDLSAKEQGPDRIFFFVPRKLKNGKYVTELMSIFDDETGLRSHGKSEPLEEILPLAASNKAVKLIAYCSESNKKPKIYVQDWESTNLVSKPFLDIDGTCPSFSPDGKQIVFISAKDKKENIISIVGTDGKNLKDIALNGENKKVDLLHFTRDGKSIVYFCTEGSSPPALYKVNINGPSKHEKICDAKGDDPQFLVSPVADEIFRINRESRYSSPEFVIIDFTDMKKVTTKVIDAGVAYLYKLLHSWSSDGKFVYITKILCEWSIVMKLDIKSGEMTEIYKNALPSKFELEYW